MPYEDVSKIPGTDQYVCVIVSTHAYLPLEITGVFHLGVIFRYIMKMNNNNKTTESKLHRPS